MLEEVLKVVRELGLPEGDAYELPDSQLRFPDGCHYRIEVSGVERPEVLEALVDESDKRGVPVHRLISMVMGSTLLDEKELRRFAEVAASAGMEVIVTPGPRAPWDIGRQLATPEGALSGIRYRGMDQLLHAVRDIMRCVKLGFRGFLVVDEGLLMILAKMKEKGLIPENTVLKMSIFAGHANPAGCRVVEMLGASTVNPVGDLTLPALAAIRKAIKIPMDFHVYLFDSWGGFNRIYDAPDVARMCAPVYFKIEPGPSVAQLYRQWAPPQHLAWLAREKVKYAEILIEIIREKYPNVKVSGKAPKDLAVPEV